MFDVALLAFEYEFLLFAQWMSCTIWSQSVGDSNGSAFEKLTKFVNVLLPSYLVWCNWLKCVACLDIIVAEAAPDADVDDDDVFVVVVVVDVVIVETVCIGDCR